jgi:hypothetical protein
MVVACGYQARSRDYPRTERGQHNHHPSGQHNHHPNGQHHCHPNAEHHCHPGLDPGSMLEPSWIPDQVRDDMLKRLRDDVFKRLWDVMPMLDHSSRQEAFD